MSGGGVATEVLARKPRTGKVTFQPKFEGGEGVRVSVQAKVNAKGLRHAGAPPRRPCG